VRTYRRAGAKSPSRPDGRDPEGLPGISSSPRSSRPYSPTAPDVPLRRRGRSRWRRWWTRPPRVGVRQAPGQAIAARNNDPSDPFVQERASVSFRAFRGRGYERSSSARGVKFTCGGGPGRWVPAAAPDGLLHCVVALWGRFHGHGADGGACGRSADGSLVRAAGLTGAAQGGEQVEGGGVRADPGARVRRRSSASSFTDWWMRVGIPTEPPGRPDCSRRHGVCGGGEHRVRHPGAWMPDPGSGQSTVVVVRAGLSGT
jgi:hypothetical protein